MPLGTALKVLVLGSVVRCALSAAEEKINFQPMEVEYSSIFPDIIFQLMKNTGHQAYSGYSPYARGKG